MAVRRGNEEKIGNIVYGLVLSCLCDSGGMTTRRLDVETLGLIAS
jgi:aminopeptidase-like protein